MTTTDEDLLLMVKQLAGDLAAERSKAKHAVGRITPVVADVVAGLQKQVQVADSAARKWETLYHDLYRAIPFGFPVPAHCPHVSREFKFS